MSGKAVNVSETFLGLWKNTHTNSELWKSSGKTGTDPKLSTSPDLEALRKTESEG